MKNTLRTLVLKLLYGLLFVVVLPTLLVLWARVMEPEVDLPRIESVPLGLIFDAAGIFLLLAGAYAIIVFGKGLPMNAFPPAEYVHNGIYRFIPHSMYAGFSMCCFGTAILFKSQSGFWLVAPIASLACAALVEGFERQDLAARFGVQVKKPLISLPEDADRNPSISERLSTYLLVLIPWALIYEAFVAIGNPPDAVTAYLPFEHHLPVIAWTEIFYGGTYIFVVIVPLAAKTSRILREFAIAGLIATAAMVLFFIGIPLISPPREFIPDGVFGKILILERSFDTSAAAFPSYHVVWAMIAARAYAKSFPSTRFLWWTLALFIAISCITTGMHAVMDVLAGIAAGTCFLRYKQVWEWMRSSSEHIANSWKEWHVGNVRIINHGIYPAVGTAIGVLIVESLLGPGSVPYAVIITMSGLIIAGLWAQLIEGSPSLLRPYGYYGGVIGIVIGAILASALGGNVWSLLGAFAVGGPVVQASGRLRCLVQGCCHGREAPPYIGIRYTHPRSRVVRLSKFEGIPIHPTPLYSILWNIVIGIFLARLWSLHAQPTLVGGLYLILNGLGRFVEEAYRGEPQTPILGKLRLYQLMAILSVVGGALLSTVKTSWIAPNPEAGPAAIIVALVIGLIIWFALGVDFPNSNRRFARLV